MPYYTDYAQECIKILEQDILTGDYSYDTLIPRSKRTVMALTNKVLQTEDLLSIFNQFTSRSLIDIQSFSIHSHIQAVLDYINDFEENKIYADGLVQRLKAILNIVTRDKPRKAEAVTVTQSIISIHEELSDKNTDEIARLFLKLAIGLYEHYGIAERQAVGALYMAAKYTIILIIENNSVDTSHCYEDKGKSALSLIEEFKLKHLEKELTCLIDLQARVQDRNTLQPVSFQAWIIEISTVLEKYSLRNRQYITNEFGG